MTDVKDIDAAWIARATLWMDNREAWFEMLHLAEVHGIPSREGNALRSAAWPLRKRMLEEAKRAARAAARDGKITC